MQRAHKEIHALHRVLRKQLLLGLFFFVNVIELLLDLLLRVGLAHVDLLELSELRLPRRSLGLVATVLQHGPLVRLGGGGDFGLLLLVLQLADFRLERLDLLLFGGGWLFLELGVLL